MIKEERKKIYSQAILSYGLVTLLCLIKEHEGLENFEECQLIFDVIKEHAIKYNIEDCPVEYNNESIEWLETEFWRLGYSGKTAIGNIESYIEEIKEKIK